MVHKTIMNGDSRSKYTLPFKCIVIIVMFGCAFSLPPPMLNDTQQQEQQPLHSIENEDYNSSSSSINTDHVMYSYSEANVSGDGIPSVRQLTIVKGKDGETRFAKNENGTVETGKWKGSIPSAPSSLLAPSVIEGIEDKMNKVTDPLLAKLNQNIGDSLQDYIMKTFSSFF